MFHSTQNSDGAETLPQEYARVDMALLTPGDDVFVGPWSCGKFYRGAVTARWDAIGLHGKFVRGATSIRELYAYSPP